MEVREAQALGIAQPGSGILEWLLSRLADLNTFFDSWKKDGGDEDALASADPELVAVLQFIASLLAEEDGRSVPR